MQVAEVVEGAVVGHRVVEAVAVVGVEGEVVLSRRRGQDSIAHGSSTGGS